jgi:hypothetical protein
MSFLKTKPNDTDAILNNNITSNESNIISYEPDIIPDNEYEVYSSAILQRNYPQSINKIVIYQLTYNQAPCDNYDCFHQFETDSMLVDDFKKKNAKAYKLENKFSIPQTVIIVSEKELNELNSKGWEAFYKKYPNSSGVIQISRVGFDNKQTQAILYFGEQSHYVAGAGYLIFLAKDEGKWMVKEQVMLWIS